MSAVRFSTSGDIIVAKGIKSVKITLEIKWNDTLQGGDGIALKEFSFSADDKTVDFSRSIDNTSGSTSKSAKLSSSADSNKTYSVSYKSYFFSISSGYTLASITPKKDSDKKISFDDGGGDSFDATITLSYSTPEYFDGSSPSDPPPGTEPPPVTGPTSCPPGEWSESVPPSCGSPPTGTSTTSGLQITKTGENQITLNLKNYANKLVTLKITHQVDADWTQGFSFNIPTCSDLDPNTSGEPYSKGQYTNNSISGTNIFYAYNVDGGDYNYVFNHSSVPGPAPWRQLYDLVCVPNYDSEGNVTSTSCSCVPSSIEEFSPWPYCATGVAISKNGGNKVQWQYEDGGGGNYDDQYVTVEVVSVRDAVPSSGPICMSTLKSRAWISDSIDTTADGDCIDDYRSHNDKIRFRIPSLQKSKTSFTDPVCFSDFRNIAGASAPGTSEAVLTTDYKVLHLFNSDFLLTESLTFDNRITVTAKNPTDVTQTDLNTTSRKYYEVEFLDDTSVSADASNISIKSDQDLTADGIKIGVTMSKKQQSSSKKIEVWFEVDGSLAENVTDDIIHVFDDNADTTNSASSTLSTSNVTVTPQSEGDEGGGTLNTIDKKHYLITFKTSDPTIVDADGSNISIIIESNTTASGLTRLIKVVKKEKVDDKNLKVWFTADDSTADAGLETDNTFVKTWSISRSRDVDISGNVYARSWTLSKVT